MTFEPAKKENFNLIENMSKNSTKQKTAVKVKKSKFKIADIKWKHKDVPLSMVIPAEKNYKIKTDLGRQRLQFSLSKFGLASSVVVNLPEKPGKPYPLINGHSRREDAIEGGLKTITISYPSRRLTPKEFKEMLAMYDSATAGDIDNAEIDKDFGHTEEWYKAWGREIPMTLLQNMGSNSRHENIKGTAENTSVNKSVVDREVVMPVQLFFNPKQEKEFRVWEDKMKSKYKVQSTTEVILKVLKLVKV